MENHDTVKSVKRVAMTVVSLSLSTPLRNISNPKQLTPKMNGGKWFTKRREKIWHVFS
jgi:hypothetical protein